MSRSTHRPGWRRWLPLVIALGWVPLMVSGRSFWIDEFATWSVASLPTLGACVDRVLQTTASEGQMPLAMVASWVQLHLVGGSEWALRAFNYPWLIVSVVAGWALGQQLRLPWFPVVLAAHPFLWFYADEFRPYAAIIAASTVVLYLLLKAVQDPLSITRVDTLMMAVAAIMLSGFSLLAMFSLGVYYGVAAVFILVRRRSFRAFMRPLLWQAPFLLALGGYYVSTLVRGASGAKLWRVNLSSIVFSMYELLGFLGLGPGRVELREAAKQGGRALVSTMEPFLIPIACLALFYTVVSALCLVRGRKREPAAAGGGSGVAVGFVCAAFVANVGLLFVAAWVVGFPFWGRHLSPLLPHTVLGACLATSYALGPGRQGWGIAILTGLFLASSLQLRFASRHEKDDYRDAAAVAAAGVDRGQTVWWAASPEGAQYYGLVSGPEGDAAASADLVLLENATAAGLEELPGPDTVVYSKPDIYDQRKALREFLGANGYRVTDRLPAFSIWAPPPEPVSP